MEINLSEYPKFKQLLMDEGDRINDGHRGGRTVYCDVVMEVTKKDVIYFGADFFPPGPIGHWLVQGAVWSYNDGYDSYYFTNACKVERKERQITTTEVYYEPVNQ